MLHLAPFSSSPHAFLPTKPSPLSPRSVNIYGRHNYMSSIDNLAKASAESSSSSSKHGNNNNNNNSIFNLSAPATTNTHIPFSQRPVKKAPSPKQDELKLRRRHQFLRKVQDQRDVRRYEARGDDMMRLDFMQRQNAYERELALSAPPQAMFEEEEEEREEEGQDEPVLESDDVDLPGWSQGSGVYLSSQREGSEVDDWARAEEEEVLALLEYMPADEEVMDDGQVDADGAESLWSDDADYDALFSEVMQQEDMNELQEPGAQHQDWEEMDMS